MGAQLSTQEELFISGEWSELLSAAANADVGVVGRAASKETGDVGFTLPVAEWQAFVSLLESGSPTVVPSLLLRKTFEVPCGSPGNAEGPSCPLLVLAVHACCWLDSELLQRMRAMVLDSLALSDDTANADVVRAEDLLAVTESLQAHLNAVRDRHGAEEANGKKGLTMVERRQLKTLQCELSTHALALYAHLARCVSSWKQARDASPGVTPAATSSEVEDHVHDAAARPSSCYAAPIPSHEAVVALKALVSSQTNRPVIEFAVRLLVSVACTCLGLLEAAGQRHSLATPHEWGQLVSELLADATSGGQDDGSLSTQPRRLSQLGVHSLGKLNVALSKAHERMRQGGSKPIAAQGLNSGGVREKLAAMVALEQRFKSKTAIGSFDGKPSQWRILTVVESALVFLARLEDAAELRAHDVLQTDHQKATAEGLSSLTDTERWDFVRRSFVGQDAAWDVVRRHFMNATVMEVDKPTVLLLFGPSGLGKTEMAKCIATAVHGIPQDEVEQSGKLVMIHMPSFCTMDSIYSLVDPPVAHVGQGILLSSLNAHGDAVVVLDEFEKGAANAVQNLWLSAFQKKGMLRSLKDSTRSVSTAKTIFVLTSNLLAESIAAQMKRYLAMPLGGGQRDAMRTAWEEECKKQCRELFGDPFVNRIDAFIPFTSYGGVETVSFVRLQLRRILASQERAKQRRVHVTQRFVEALASSIRSFHAATVEDTVKPLLAKMARMTCSEAVLSVEEFVGTGLVYVVAPVAYAGGSSGIARCETTDVAIDSYEWQGVPGGEDAIRAQHRFRGWSPCDSMRPAESHQDAHSVLDVPSLCPPGDEASKTVVGEKEARLAVAPSKRLVTERLLETQVEKVTEKELLLQVSRLRQVIVEKDLEIMRLKQKITALQLLLAVCFCMALAMMLVTTLLLGLRITAAFASVSGLLIMQLVRDPLQVLLGALRVLYHAFGFRGCAAMFAALSAWLYVVVSRAAWTRC